MRLLRMICLVLLLVTALPISTGVYAQDGTAQVGVFEPFEVAPNELVQVPISVRDVQNLYGVDLLLSFDPALVQVEDADPSSSGIQAGLGEFLDPGLLLFNKADNTAGTYHFVMSQYNPSEPKTGEGVIVVITFRGIGEGVSPLTVMGLKLASREGTEIASSPVDSTLTVRAGAPTQAATMPVVDTTGMIVLNTATPTPTATPVPTATLAPVIQPTLKPTEASTKADNLAVVDTENKNESGLRQNNSWWINLTLLAAVIAAGIFIYAFKKKITRPKE